MRRIRSSRLGFNIPLYGGCRGNSVSSTSLGWAVFNATATGESSEAVDGLPETLEEDIKQLVGF